MGDSYIAGESGRWDGNSSISSRDRRGTDRAAYRRGWFWRYDTSRVYGDSGACHRSDVAPLESADLAVDSVFNLACSGAATQNLLPALAGGLAHKAEAPQIDQLAVVIAKEVCGFQGCSLKPLAKRIAILQPYAQQVASTTYSTGCAQPAERCPAVRQRFRPGATSGSIETGRLFR